MILILYEKKNAKFGSLMRSRAGSGTLNWKIVLIARSLCLEKRNLKRRSLKHIVILHILGSEFITNRAGQHCTEVGLKYFNMCH